MKISIHHYWQKFALLILLACIPVLLIKNRRLEQQKESQVSALYSCPMHASVTSDHPDHCPICHMELQKVDETSPAKSVKKEPRRVLFYRNPMHADVTSPVPAKDEMGMDYLPVFADELSPETERGAVVGRASFNLSPDRQQLIGVTTARAIVQPLNVEIRANGKVAFDPELYTAIEEYRQALLSRDQMKDNPYPTLQEQSSALLESARTKLRLMGLEDSQIRRLGSTQANSMTLLLPKGQAWVYAEIFEYEVAGVKNGQSVEVAAPSLSGEIFRGKIASVSPILTAATRTIRVRALVPDPKNLLRPDTFVNVKIQVFLGQKLSVPTDSILHSGDQDFVFVVSPEGKFEPRAVLVGQKAKDFVEIVRGVEKGETVATAANFLIDSESKLRAAIRNAQDLKSAPVSPLKAKTGEGEAHD